MNAKKAKRLRREIYGDTSLKIKRVYVGRFTIRNAPSSPRAQYQLAKKRRTL